MADTAIISRQFVRSMGKPCLLYRAYFIERTSRVALTVHLQELRLFKFPGCAILLKNRQSSPEYIYDYPKQGLTYDHRLLPGVFLN